MKKILILVVSLLFLITGCTNKTLNQNTKKENKEEKIITISEENKDIQVTDADVVNYVENIENDLDNTKEKSASVNKNSLKDIFVTLTDFIFYDGTIKGKTFKELGLEAKTKILELYEKIDSKIESVYPNYKEDIKDTSTKAYSKVKEKTIELKDYLKDIYIERVGENTYQKELEAYEKVKEEVKEKTAPVIKDVKEKAKDTYTNVKDKLDKWYQGVKESSE